MKVKLPEWFKQEIPTSEAIKLMHLFSEFGVNTVCQAAKCPNISHCFKNKKVTFMILGDICTRNCKFCHVTKLKGIKLSIDKDEPKRIAYLVKLLGLKYVVITSVTRDDLADGGAKQFAKTIESVRAQDNKIKIEVLIPDFQAKITSLKCVLNAKPDVVAHNIETVKRLYHDLRPTADYERSLEVLKSVKKLQPTLITKSSIMLGLGETEEEVISTMKDLRGSLCDILTLGQYLAPSADHYPVREFISIESFKRYKEISLTLGFKTVQSAPLVRSSYRAEETYKELAYV
jgi:lipoic acid synthetase